MSDTRTDSKNQIVTALTTVVLPSCLLLSLWLLSVSEGITWAAGKATWAKAA